MPSIRTIAVLAALSIVLSAGGSGCSGKRVMVRTARTLLPDAMAAFNDEPDRELARTAGFSNLKYLETLHRAAPGDQEILVALAQAFGGMAVAFLEDDMEAARGVDEARFDEARQRAAAFYRRGQEYAGQALELRHPGILQKLEGGGADQALRELNGDDLPALFWYAFDQGGALWLSRSEPAALRELPLNRRLILRAIELDETYFFGGPLLLRGLVDATLPPLLGGSLEAGDLLVSRAIEISDGRFLLARVLHARFVALPAGDRERFDDELDAVLAAPLDVLPGYRLFTVVAQRRAERLKARAEQLFQANYPHSAGVRESRTGKHGMKGKE